MNEILSNLYPCSYLCTTFCLFLMWLLLSAIKAQPLCPYRNNYDVEGNIISVCLVYFLLKKCKYSMHLKLEKLFIPNFSYTRFLIPSFVADCLGISFQDRQNYLFICPLVGFSNSHEVVRKRKDCLSKGLAHISDFPTAWLCTGLTDKLCSNLEAYILLN